MARIQTLNELHLTVMQKINLHEANQFNCCKKVRTSGQVSYHWEFCRNPSGEPKLLIYCDTCGREFAVSLRSLGLEDDYDILMPQ
jgi:hypothetical protein